MSTSYDVVNLDLTPVHTLTQIVGPATTVTSVTVLAFPAGVAGFLRLGQSGAPIPVVEGLEIKDICEREGVWYQQAVAAAGIGRFAWFATGFATMGP